MIVNSYGYEPFGKPLYSTESIDNDFQYVGQFGVRKADDDLFFMRNRFYSASLGRFTSEDPIGLAGGDVSFYRYVSNNPINFIDPWGLAQIGGRRLNHPLVPSSPTGPHRHDQIWYDDGSNSGFFADDRIGTDIGHTIDEYDFSRDPNHYDDNLLRQAERNVRNNWNMNWHWLLNNCQDYVIKVRQEYERLKNEKPCN